MNRCAPMHDEAAMLFDDIVKEDRSVLEILGPAIRS